MRTIPEREAGEDAVLESSFRWGCVRRDGRIVFGRVGVTVVRDVRLAADPPSRQRVRVQFLERLSTDLRRELERLIAARGISGKRLAERLEPIEVVWEELRGRQRLLGRLDPPTTQRQASLEDISFPVREQGRAHEDRGRSEGSARMPSPHGDR